MKLALPTSDIIQRITSARSQYITHLERLCISIKFQLELIDDMDTDGCEETNSESILRKIVLDIKTMDMSYIQDIISYNEDYFRKCLDNNIKCGEVIIINDAIFNKRCTLKKPLVLIEDIKTVPTRRLSFLDTKFADGDVILYVQRLREMSDLDYLLSLNGYNLPFCNSTSDRSMYEGFFNVFIRDILKIQGFILLEKAYVFNVLQETIFSIHIITELCVDLIECILEIIHAINIRVKMSNANIDKKISIEPINIPILDHIKSCLSNKNKAFLQFKTHKLISSVDNEQTRAIFTTSKESNWLTKIRDYHNVISDAVDIYIQNCDVFISTTQQLNNSEYNYITAYLNNIIIFIQGFKTFLEDAKNPKGAYQTCYKSGYDLLVIINETEEQFPIKYGNKPNTPISKDNSQRSELRT